jgi:bifunctional DNase/RNase
MHDASTDHPPIVMRVAAVVVDPATQSPVLILRGLENARLYLPIFIGGLEATAIASVLFEVKWPRPMTHDLMATMLGELGWTLRRATVTALRDSTFFAELLLVDAHGTTRTLDARPSDSIALALRTEAEICVAKDVLEEAGGVADEVPDEDAPATPGEAPEGRAPDTEAQPASRPAVVSGREIRLEDLDPETFGKYKM